MDHHWTLTRSPWHVTHHSTLPAQTINVRQQHTCANLSHARWLGDGGGGSSTVQFQKLTPPPSYQSFIIMMTLPAWLQGCLLLTATVIHPSCTMSLWLIRWNENIKHIIWIIVYGGWWWGGGGGVGALKEYEERQRRESTAWMGERYYSME